MKNYYFIVRSEFINDLGLTGIPLLVFSIIFSCESTGSRWYGGQNRMALMLDCSLKSINRAITFLSGDVGYIDVRQGSISISQNALDKMSIDKDKMSIDKDKMSKIRKEPKELLFDNDFISVSNEYVSDDELNELLETLN